MQIDRLFGIVYFLLNQKTATAGELAERFEVSRRTILRDIETLSGAGIPIYTTPGRGGGVSILDNFVLNKATVSDEEQNQILFALQSLGSAGQAEAADTLSKLRALFDKEDADWIEVDFSRWGAPESDKEKFGLLKQAILKRKAVSFDYASAYGETAGRKAVPLKLAFKSKAWYLQAYCLLRREYRTFKINRILSVRVLEESFAGQAFLPPPVEIAEPFPERLVPLVVRFSRCAAYRVYDEFDPKDVTRNEDGSFTVAVYLPDDYWIYGFLLSFGTAAEVLSPQSVRENLLREVEKMKSRLSGN